MKLLYNTVTIHFSWGMVVWGYTNLQVDNCVPDPLLHQCMYRSFSKMSFSAKKWWTPFENPCMKNIWSITAISVFRASCSLKWGRYHMNKVLFSRIRTTSIQQLTTHSTPIFRVSAFRIQIIVDSSSMHYNKYKKSSVGNYLVWKSLKASVTVLISYSLFQMHTKRHCTIWHVHLFFPLWAHSSFTILYTSHLICL